MLKKAKFQSKMIFYHICIVVAIMIILIGIFYQYVVTAMTERANNDFETIISNMVTQFDNHLYSMDKTALQIAANPNIVRLFQKVDKNLDGNYFIQEPVIAAEVVKLLNSYNFKRDGVARICLYNNSNDFVCTATTMTTVTGMEKFFAGDDFQSIQEYFKEDNHFILYTFPEKDVLNDTALSQKNYFSVVREIKDYSSGSLPCGYVEVQDYAEKMETIFEDLGADGYVVILDENKKIIYKSSTAADKAEQEESIEELLGLIHEDQLEYGSIYKNGRYVSYKKMPRGPFTILFEKRRNPVLEPLIQFNLLMIMGALLSLLTAVVTEILIIRRLSRPLVELNRSIKNMNTNHFQIDIASHESNDELQQLGETFNTMLEQLKRTVEKQYAAETNALKTQLFALQSQMNPHFMYNILAIISMEAQEDKSDNKLSHTQTGTQPLTEHGSKNEKIQNICAKLCRMLSFSSSMNDGFCTMEEEIKNADNYMALMKERYEVLFEYFVKIDPKLQKVRIPKLIVQPICENCFKHAFKNREPVWKLTISVFEKENKWYIEIQDNGEGFQAQYLERYEKMRREITLENVQENLEKISIGGLCIPNIYMRLKICYDDDFTCDLYNNELGAVVLLGGKIND